MDVNTKRNLQGVAIHDASANGFIEMAEFLLDNYADPNVVNEEGVTPLIAAVTNGHDSMVDLLLQRGNILISIV